MGQGQCFFPPTSWQVSNIHAGTGASNVIPGECVVDFNFRFCTESTPEQLQQRLSAVLDKHGLNYDLKWTIGGLPFLTTPGDLVGAVQGAIRDVTGLVDRALDHRWHERWSVHCAGVSASD